MFLKISDFHIGIGQGVLEAKKYCKDYICDGDAAVDFTVDLSDEDIAYERAEAERENPGIGFSRGNFENLALYRKICAQILKYDAFMMHGAVIEYEGKGYLFTAKSGTGKTTHIRLWKKLFGDDKVTIVNGDKPIIRFIDGKVYAYGTPWNGKEHYGTNSRVELSAICFLERGEENSIKKISDIEALPRIFSQIMIHDSADLGKQMELVDKLFEKVPTYLLECNMDVEAAKVAYEGMSGQGAEK